jgi:hypothetical protein
MAYTIRKACVAMLCFRKSHGCLTSVLHFCPLLFVSASRLCVSSPLAQVLQSVQYEVSRQVKPGTAPMDVVRVLSADSNTHWEY